MNCREALKRLNELPADRPIESDRDLRAHLESCPDCAVEADRHRQLRQLLSRAGADDTEHLRPMAVQQVEVSARLARQSEQQHVRRVRRYALGAVTMVVLIATVMLAPWRDGSVTGYELAVDGVSTDLAGDHDRLCDMLFSLGAVNAGVDVAACDTSCQVIIFDLRTRDEARLVEAAIRNLSSNRIKVDVVPVRHGSTET